MKLLPSQTDEVSLLAFGEQARALLMQRNYSGLADRFGYALAWGRPLSEAIEADFLRAAASPYKVVPGDQHGHFKLGRSRRTVFTSPPDLR